MVPFDAFATADLCDAFPEAIRILPPMFRSFGGLVKFAGPAVTVRVRDDNAAIKAILKTDGHGRVLVVDNEGSMKCALIGDQVGKMAVDRGWAGVLVHGCVRDTAQLREFPLGVLALAPLPKRPGNSAEGDRDVTVRIGGVDIAPGEWIYADHDGVLVASHELPVAPS